jgi:amino acid transporter
VVLSTVATVETTLIQVTRTLFVMGRDHTLPKRLGTVHPVRKTPLFATITVAILSLILFIGSQFVGSINKLVADGISAIVLQICIYYCLAGLAVVILYRRQLLRSLPNFVFMGLWPLRGRHLHGLRLREGDPRPLGQHAAANLVRTRGDGVGSWSR